MERPRVERSGKLTSVGAVLAIDRRSVIRRKTLQLAAVSCFLSALAGCIPATYVTVPAIRGRVVDASSQPLAGAEVEIERAENDQPIAFVKTSVDGTFERPEDSHFFLYIVPADNFLPRYTVQVHAGGGTSATTQVSSGVRYFFVFGPPASGRDVGELTVDH